MENEKEYSTITVIYEDIKYVFSPKFVGENIQKIRKEKHITKKYMMDGWFEELSSSDIDNWENGINLPGIEDLEYLANCVLDVSLEYLLSGKEKEESDCWSFISVEAEANRYINGVYCFFELSDEAKEYCYKNKKVNPDDECGEYLDGNRDFLELSDEAKQAAYKRHVVDLDDEIRDYKAGNRKKSELSFYAALNVDMNEEDDEKIEFSDLSYNAKETVLEKMEPEKQAELFKDEQIEFNELSDEAKEIAIEEADENEQIELYESGEIEFNELSDNARKTVIQSLSPEEQVELFKDGTIEFLEMTVEAQVWYYEVEESDD